jgi:hypothetical protein
MLRMRAENVIRVRRHARRIELDPVPLRRVALQAEVAGDGDLVPVTR